MKERMKGYDYTLIITPVLLAGFGIVMIYSASMVSAVVDGLDSTYYFFKQLQWFVLALIGYIFCCIFPYKYYQNLTKTIIVISGILLIAVLLFGETANKATRSIELLGFNIQPSEFVKLALIIYLASVYSKKQQYINDFKKGVLPPLFLTVVMVGLIVLQPDIGTATIILLIVGTLIISSGIRMKHILLLGLFSSAIILMIFPKMITETRIARFTGAYQPFLNPESEGFHLIQSYLAIGGGGLSGEGLGQSIQKLGYLWGAHTDFIMAIVAEELGIFGVIIVIGLITVIVLRGLYIAKKCKNSFGSLLAIGISSMIGFQAIINLGAISGLLPITGVTLPFISYGGSSLLVLMLSMGILNNVARTVNLQEQEPKVIETEDLNTYRHRRGSTWPI
ncbi:FtsW/RodA/SpoVE family cell cycle protein [Pseudogracilibacillus sp. SE30717A]|uniref:FtsW/RodA/SpoVE family cell cycle protein n=1 Tax=Pseudogracilibacillus sp. SE30717A TaxID=3098293 RepID=UPI00300E5FDD